ncbi:SHOCT domain-containing protein [Halobaculum limi]|uniref:SHOCT domain-containing protein n=1 Tax=Halobaculum limi TaxID=3031916 RepID=UPI0024059831|nr:SHOCT domain-containing protein [Halobaculum sp. YSMS11]
MITLTGLVAQVGPHAPMGPGPHGPAGGGWMGSGWMGGGLFPWLGPWAGLFVMLLVLGLLAAVVYAAVTLAQDADGDRPDDAVSVLDRRYARGEVDDEEYRERRRRLTDG